MSQHDTESLNGLFSNPSAVQKRAIMQTILSALGPRQQGVSRVQSLANAGAQGLNYLTRTNALRAGARNEAQKLRNDTITAEAGADNLNEATRLKERKTDQVDRDLQIRAYQALTDRQKSQLALKSALGKAKNVKGENRQKVLIELIKQQTARETAGQQSNPLEVISLMNLYLEEDFSMDGAIYNPDTGLYSVYTSAGAVFNEDTKSFDPVILDGLSAGQVTAYGINAKETKKLAIARQKQEKARSTPEVSAARGIEPTDFSRASPSVEGDSLQDTVRDFTGIGGQEEEMAKQINSAKLPPGISKIQALAKMLRDQPQGTARYPTEASALEQAALILKRLVPDDFGFGDGP